MTTTITTPATPRTTGFASLRKMPVMPQPTASSRVSSGRYTYSPPFTSASPANCLTALNISVNIIRPISAQNAILSPVREKNLMSDLPCCRSRRSAARPRRRPR